MAHLQDGPQKLQAITINGAIVVESEEDIKRRQERRKNRKSRWGNSSDSVSSFAPAVKKSSIVIPGDPSSFVSTVKESTPSSSSSSNPTAIMMPTLINTSNMDEKAQKMYLLKMQIQEATMKLQRPDLGIPINPKDRSPSPEPVYNNKGIRINTREDRTKNKLINQRNAAITRLKELDPTYQPPSQFHYKNTELEDRVNIPADEYPQINFMGLLLGPRGKFLDEIMAKTKCTIVLRGKGSLKSGMTGITKQGKLVDALEEPLHAHITGSTAEDVKKAVKTIQDIINLEVYHPDSEEAVARRSKHMHELAILNGTVKEAESKCLNCGRFGHMSWQCEESSIFTASVICSACGGVGHVTSDCKQDRPGAAFNKKGNTDPEVIDEEYESFLSDLDPSRKSKKKGDKDSYVPPMGDLSKALKASTAAPLMLTCGVATPGAASAHARAISSGQQLPGGMLKAMGKSIFGGKLTRLTSGYKSQGEREMEQRRKMEEYENRPVPLEWQVERMEKSMNQNQDDYLKKLERYAEEHRKLKEQETVGAAPCLPPPPPPPGSRGAASRSSDDDLPGIIGAPMANLRR